MGTSEFHEVKRSFKLDPSLICIMHKTSEILNFYFEFLKSPYVKKTNLKNFGGCRQGAVYVLSFITLGALAIIKFRAKREKIFRKVLPFHKKTLFYLPK